MAYSKADLKNIKKQEALKRKKKREASKGQTKDQQIKLC